MRQKPSLQDVLSVITGDRSEPERRRHAASLSALTSSMARFGHDRSDPVRMIQICLGDRWISLVMHLLSGGMLGCAELRRLTSLVSAERQACGLPSAH